MVRRLRKILLVTLLALLVLVLISLLAGTLAMRGSLPRLDGQVSLSGLSGDVVVTRDDYGVPDITADNRLDAARALGFVHAQDRFFQMDLQRRSAAGELAALFGSGAVGADRRSRLHRFRHRAQLVVRAETPENQAILTAYTAGVNAGLQSLKTRPVEYLLLRQKPQPWMDEDIILTLYAMFMDLSLSTARAEGYFSTVHEVLPEGLAEFLLPRSNRWEAPLQPDPVPGVSIPDSSVFDVRDWTYGGLGYEEFKAQSISERETTKRQDSSGSNNWAVAGSLTGHGGALLANDMHLGHSLPNIWYRARMNWPGHSVVGVTLPGTPSLVSGSNGHLAWGFTNSYGDWSDLVPLELDPENPTRYRTPEGWQTIRRVPEIITVQGADNDTLWVEETIWGPLYDEDVKGRLRALRWTAHDTEAVNINLLKLETAEGVDQAIALAGTVGIPQQNLVMADADGRIAWTIAGFIPNRVGWDGYLPVSWADGTCRWDGYRPAADQPHIVDPEEGRVWSANARVVGGEDLAIIGDGGYALGARNRQIRDGLRAMDKPLEKDLLALQLDDRALFLDQWRQLALDILAKHPPAEGSRQALFRKIVRDQWSGRAEPQSVSYRLVRDFKNLLCEEILKLLTGACKGADPDFRSHWLPHYEAVTWQIFEERPAHILPPWSADWDDALLQAIGQVMANAEDFNIPIEEYTWGQRNVVEVAHPFTQVVPALSRWFNAPALSLPGDSYMPRVQGTGSGASERLVVSPGREDEAIFHMPGGQSGHFLSPYYLKGIEDWAEGRATALLPGPEEHRLVLKPAQGQN